MSNKIIIGGVILVAVGFLIVGGFYSGNTASQSASVHNSALGTALQKDPAPDFTLQKLGGGTISLSEFRGKKPVVVDFWASWCPNCRRDMPNLKRFYEKYKDKVEVIGVNLQEKESTVKNFVESRGISFPIAFDPRGGASRAFGIQYTNTHFLIDINGNLVRTIPGDISEADIVSLIEQANAPETQSSAPDEKPCKIASAEGGQEAGVCKNETLSIPNEDQTFSTKEIMVTNGTKHSVPLNEILGGGPPKDGIPSIDNPKFVSIAEASKLLNDSEPGIALNINDTARFYPFQILVWHEVVNDTINGQRVLVTYCPLCLSGIVFDPVVQGERVEFGTSGKLWNSNLVMYDRHTLSLWSQILGEAIVGDMTGTQLKVLPSDMTRFSEFKKQYPEGSVLSRDTGAKRFYGQDPYGDYYTTPGTYFPVGNKDNRLGDKDFVLGIVVNGKAKAYWPEVIKKAEEITDQFEGKVIVARYEKEIDAVRLFEKKADGAVERINPFGAFWFSWVAAHPDTELLK